MSLKYPRLYLPSPDCATAPLPLLRSKAWRQKGKLYAKRLWGLESIWTRIRGAFGTLSEGTGLLMGAMKVANDHQLP